MENKSSRMFGINGTEGSDSGALTPEQQSNLNEFKTNTRIANEKYLREHPEVGCLITGFLGNILQERPDNIREFAAKYFSNRDLPLQISLQVAEYNAQMKRPAPRQ